VEQAVESHLRTPRNVGLASEWRFYGCASTIANGATSPRRSVECTKDAVPKCSPEAMKGLPIKQYSFMLVWIASSFQYVVCIACLLRGEALAEPETKDTTRDETMTKKENTGLVLMLGSAAAAIQLTIFFSPILRGWFYSICLGALIIVFASGADLFRGNE
jgi:hypothetical protein